MPQVVAQRSDGLASNGLHVRCVPVRTLCGMMLREGPHTMHRTGPEGVDDIPSAYDHSQWCRLLRKPPLQNTGLSDAGIPVLGPDNG